MGKVTTLLTPEQERKEKFMKAMLMAQKPKQEKNDVKCKKHGKTPAMSYKVHEVEKIKVCFLCYAEKQTEGLTNFVN